MISKTFPRDTKCVFCVSGNYGFSGMQEFSRMAKREGICEATQDKVPNNADEQAFELVWTLPHSYHAIRYILRNIYMHTFAFFI